MKNALIISSAVTAAGLFFLRIYIRGTDIVVDPSVRADGKVVIVTGSNTGIGKETVKELAKRGATIYMACRSMERCNKAKDEIISETKHQKIYCKKCDLEDFASIRQFAKEFKSQEKKLDILINNGGVMHNPRMLTKQGIELQFGVNHVGHFLLTDLLLEELKRASPSRIVVVSSLAHERGKIHFEDLNSEKSYSPTGAYEQSKLANVLFANQLAKKLEGTGVTVNSLHPGVIATDLMRHYTFIEQNPIGIYFVKPLFHFLFKTPYQGALTSIYVAIEPSLQKVTGKYFSDCAEKTAAPQALNKEDAQRLWTITEKLIKDKS